MKNAFKFILLFVLGSGFLFHENAEAQCLVISTTQTDVSCFGGTDGTITLTITPGTSPSAQAPYSIQLYYFSSGLTQLASYSNVNSTTITFKQGDGSLNSPGADAFGIPANQPGEYYRIDVQSTGGTFVCRNKILFPINISEPTQLTASVNSVTPACTPGTGAISLNVSGGTPLAGGPPNYVYNWSGSAGTTAIANTVQNPTNINGGTYNVTIVDANGCSTTLSNIAVALSTVSNAGPNQVVCANSATLAGSAPGPGEVGLWTLVSGSGTITNPNQANTTVTGLGVGNNVFNWFIDDVGHICPGSNSSVTISWFDLQLNKTADVALLCFGNTNGTGTFTASGGTAPYSFSVTSNTTGGTTSTTATTLSLSNGGAGSITVKVTDANGCNQSATINITQPAAALALNKTADVALACFGDTNGTGTFTASGGTAPYSFSVTSNTTGGTTSTTATTLSLSNGAVGSITVKVTDANGCNTSATINITQPASALLLSKTADVALLCFGNTNGTGTFTASGGTSPYSFSVTSNTTGGTTSTTATTLTLSNAGVGSITVKVTDANGCNKSATINVTQPAAALVLNKTADVALACFGDTNGTGTFTASGGTAPYSFSVTSNTTGGTTSTTATTLSLSNGGAGAITVKVTDANGCNTSATINITQPASALVLVKSADVALLCFGDTNGSGTFTASGGTSPYSFTVTSNTTGGTTSTTATTLTLSNAGVGSITVKVTDAKGCNKSATINITQPASALVLNKTADVALACFGDTNGTGTFTASGGTSPYTFSVTSNTTGGTTSTTATTLSLSNGGVGSITVKVTDANGCNTSATIGITQPASALSLSKTADVALLCFGDTNGTGTFTASGGTSPYSFTVTTNTTGGTTSTTATTLSLSNGGAGTIMVKVTDAKGCNTSATINITQPLLPLLLIKSADVALLCFGDTNGTGTFTVSGGTSPYSFSVTSNTTGGTTSTTATTLTLSNAGVGSITVKVTDANGCNKSATINITQPASALSLSKTADVALLCFGDTNGTGTFTASGGTSPYNFTVTSNTTGGTTSTTATTMTLSNGGVGSITVKVTDANGCNTSATINITQPASAVVLNKTADVALLCFGDTNGSGTFTASGGTSPYVFSVSGNTTGGTTATTATTLTLSNGGVGSITVKVTDANGCNISATINITQPAAALALSKTADVVLACFGDANGTGTFTASGGTAPYNFTVTSNTTSGTTSTTATTLSLSNGAIGAITVQVTDANGCNTSATINITQPASALSLNKTADVALLCFGNTNGTGTFTASGGTSPYSFAVTSNTTGGTTSTTATTLDLSNAGVGSITVKVTDAGGCASSATINITQPASALVLVKSADVALACFGDTNGTGTFTTAGGTSPYSFTVMGNTTGGTTSTTATTLSLSNGGVGSITVQATDANGCNTSATINITQPAAPLAITSVSKIDATCLGVNDGTIQVNGVTGGTAPYKYSSDNGATFQGSNTFSNLAPATYQVVVKDKNGCVTAATSTTINNGTAITITTSSANATCNGTTDGSITVNTVSGGTGPYTYSDDNGVTFQASNTFAGLGVNNYQVIAKDKNGCQSAPATVAVGSNTTITFLATPTNASCAGINDGQIVITNELGGTGLYTYSKDNGATFQASTTFSGLAPASYNMVIKDAAGCSSSAVATVVGSNTTITINTVNHTDATCSGVNDGTIDVTTVSGGTSPYTYSIDNGTTFQGATSFASLAANTYQVIVKDNNGCTSAPSSVIVAAGSVITITTSKVDASCGGNSDGSITVTTVTGGSPTYTYSSDGGATFQASNVLGSLAANTYSVVVKDNGGCLSTPASVTINNSVSITPNFTKTDASCAANDGSIVINTVSGGASPYQYSINNGVSYQASSTFTNLGVATYQLVVKDNNGCLSTPVSVVISKPGVCGGSNCGVYTILATDTRPTCSGQDDGTITINVSGGSPNYIATLSDAAQGFSQALAGPGPFTFVNLSPSLTYQYTIQDGAGNTCTLSYSLPIQTNVQASAAGFVDAQCFNQAVGQATVTVTSGGTSPYEYSLDAGTTWISFTSPVTITNLMPAAAPYSILVRDDASDLCPAQVSVTINNAVQDIKTTFTETDATCANNDGTITVSHIKGGTGPYTYRFDSVNVVMPADSTFRGLAGGTHKFTVIDANGCNKYFSTVVNFPGLVNFITSISNPSCGGNGNDGSVTALITSSGTFDFGITTDPINDPAVFQTIISAGNSPVVFPALSQGTYYVVAKPSGPGVLCSTRSLGVIINGGPVAVDFGFEAKDFVCFETKGIVRVFNIKGASSVDFNYEILQSGNVVQSGTITYLQSLPPDTLDYTGLDKGNYQIRVFQDQSAASGCGVPISSNYKPFSIQGPAAALDTLYVNRKFSLPNLPTGSMLIGISESQEQPYQLKLHLVTPHIQGQKNNFAFDSTWVSVARNNQTQVVEFSANNIYAGDYQLSIRDTLGCTKVYDLSINFDTDIFIPNVFTPNSDGKNDTFYILNLPDNANLVVTNRWGKEVYHSSNYGASNSWWNGGAESDGIYFYRLSAGGKTYTGWVEIMHPSY